MISDRQNRLDREQDIAAAGSFPASDPPANVAESGARAVPPQELMGQDKRPIPADAVTIRHRFPDADAAKLVLEALVRDVPIDRDCAEIVDADGGAELRLTAPPADAARIRRQLDRA